MTRVFADTSYWIALTLPKDEAHEAAMAFEGPILTTHEVLSEYLAYFSAAPTHLRGKAGNIVAAVLGDPETEVIEWSGESFVRAFHLYRARPDKGYSLVDCASMNAMRQRGIVECLTSDNHFAQEGFVALLA